MDLKAYLRRCRQRVEGLLEAMDHAKILLLVTNQQQSLSHPKLLSLPYGVSPNVAAKIALLLSELGAAADRPALVAISNVRGHYSNKVMYLHLHVQVVCLHCCVIPAGYRVFQPNFSHLGFIRL